MEFERYEKEHPIPEQVECDKQLKFNSAEKWVNYIYEEFSFKEKNINDLDDERLLALQELIEQIPIEFNDNQKIKELRKISQEIHKRFFYSINDVWFGWGYCPSSIDDSIVGLFEDPEDEVLNAAFTGWFECARDDYNHIKSDIYEPCRTTSIDLLALAEMEFRELDRFFKSGVSTSMAINDKKDVFRFELKSQEIYEYYLNLIKGSYDFFIERNEYIDFCRLGQEVLAELPSDSEKYKRIDCSLQQLEMMKQATTKALRKTWWLAARVQALLWIRINLKEAIKAGKKKNKRLKISMDDFVKQGFQVAKPEITQALYQALIEHTLIKDEGLKKFKQAFEGGEGSITWLKGTASHGVGVNSLIYLIDNLWMNELVEDVGFITITASIFTDVNGEAIKYKSLMQSNNSNKKKLPSNYKIINGVVNALKNL